MNDDAPSAFIRQIPSGEEVAPCPFCAGMGQQRLAGLVLRDVGGVAPFRCTAGHSFGRRREDDRLLPWATIGPIQS